MTGSMTRVMGAALVLGALWFVGSLGAVHACKCVVPGSPAEEMEKFDAVFAGEVISVSHSFDPNVTPRKHGDRTTVGFDVSTVWKGVVHERMFITTPPTGGSCGFAFSEGEPYIVYASLNAAGDAGYQASICSRTALLRQAQADLDALGEGRAPRAGTVGPQPDQSPESSAAGVWVALLVTAVTLILLGGVLAYASRRWR
ncbi:MAG: hypothetical protein OXP73_06800 [Chloroflexota bacterium]|nr:hypothetical protein [Chloroflexota bacterium]